MRPCVFSISKDNGHSRKSRDSKTIEVMMKKLSELTKDKSGLIAGINGDARQTVVPEQSKCWPVN